MFINVRVKVLIQKQEINTNRHETSVQLKLRRSRLNHECYFFFSLFNHEINMFSVRLDSELNHGNLRNKIKRYYNGPTVIMSGFP